MKTETAQFKEFEEGLGKHVQQESKVHSSIDPQALHEMAVNIALYLVLDVEAERWPNIYRIAKPLLSKAVVIKSRYQNSEEVQKLKQLMNEITSTLDKCIQTIDKIMYMTRLPKARRGKCEFI
jgi:3-deoxy-D-manno-octulosonic-acid transferase